MVSEAKPNDLNDAVRAGCELGEEPVPLDRQVTPAPRKLSEIIGPALERMGKRASGEEKPIPMPKDWQPLADSLHGGWWPNEQYIAVGGTGIGKTAFALQTSLVAAKDGSPVLYVPLELDDTQLVARFLAGENRIDWSQILYGQDKDALATAKKSASMFDDLPFYIREPTGGTIANLADEAKAVREAEGCNKPMLVVLDFLQLVSSNGRDLRESIREAAYCGTDIAREYNAAMVMLSSTAREHYATLDETARPEKDRRPPPIGEGSASAMVGVGKESGEIEYAASNLLVFCRDKNEGGWVALAKTRAGKPMWLRCDFEGSLGTFSFTAHTQKQSRPEDPYIGNVSRSGAQHTAGVEID